MEKKSWDLIVKVIATLAVVVYGLVPGGLMVTGMVVTFESTMTMWLVSLGMLISALGLLLFVWWPRKKNTEGSSS